MNIIKVVLAMCSENKNFHIVSRIVFAPDLSSAAFLVRWRPCVARRQELILTAWPSISSSKEMELSDFNRELGTAAAAAAAAAFTLSWHRWMKPGSWKKKLSDSLASLMLPEFFSAKASSFNKIVSTEDRKDTADYLMLLFSCYIVMQRNSAQSNWNQQR